MWVATIVGSLVLGFVSLLLPSAPTYDPWAWIIWGREIAHLDLNTVHGPSWKPLPVILTTITAPLGEASPYIWVAVARAGAIAGIVLSGVLAARLANRTAGVVAAVALAATPWWLRRGAMGNSEGLMVALVVGAVLCHLQGRKGWAFALAIGAGLLRPEAWPFLGLYALVLLWEDRARLKWIAGGLAVLPVLWFAPEYWGSGNALRASDRARDPRPDSPAFADHPAVEVIKDAVGLVPVVAVVFAVVAFALAGVVLARRPAGLAARLPDRRRAIAVLAPRRARGGVDRAGRGHDRPRLQWQHALPHGPRRAAHRPRRRGRRVDDQRRAPRLTPPAAIVTAVVLAALFVAQNSPHFEPTLREIEYQADLYHDLGRVIDDAGGAAHLRSCGHAFTDRFLVPQVAWRLRLRSGEVDFRPRGERAVIFHVRNTRAARVTPPYTLARPIVLGRRGHWALTADCEARG